MATDRIDILNQAPLGLAALTARLNFQIQMKL
jgi:hypothetical protein